MQNSECRHCATPDPCVSAFCMSAFCIVRRALVRVLTSSFSPARAGRFSGGCRILRSGHLRGRRRSRSHGHRDARRAAPDDVDRCAGHLPDHGHRGRSRGRIQHRDAWVREADARGHDWSRCAAGDVGALAAAVRGDHARPAAARARPARAPESAATRPSTRSQTSAPSRNAANRLSARRRDDAAGAAVAAGGGAAA